MRLKGSAPETVYILDLERVGGGGTVLKTYVSSFCICPKSSAHMDCTYAAHIVPKPSLVGIEAYKVICTAPCPTLYQELPHTLKTCVVKASCIYIQYIRYIVGQGGNCVESLHWFSQLTTHALSVYKQLLRRGVNNLWVYHQQRRLLPVFCRELSLLLPTHGRLTAHC